jgi:hypothetical protein
MDAHIVACRVRAVSATVFSIAMAFAPSPLQAQAEVESDWTVLTISNTGAWGLSTARSQTHAIAGALRQCRARAARSTDCGAEFIAYRSGWSEAILCGDHGVLVAAGDHDQADAMAYARIAELRHAYGSSLPTCRRLLVVDPWGAVTAGPAAVALQ